MINVNCALFEFLGLHEFTGLNAFRLIIHGLISLTGKCSRYETM